MTKNMRQMYISDSGLMTFGGHLDVMRRMFFRILAITFVVGVAVFCCKETVFKLLLAPCNSGFVTYRFIERLAEIAGFNYRFEPFRVQLINTELSSQFMLHMSTSACLALLFASPYVLMELYRFITPALYAGERRYSVPVCVAVYMLFMLGVTASYFILFPFALRFLGTYQVSPDVVNQINISSYISTFTTTTLLMGLVFQLPVLSFILAKFGLLKSAFMKRYRRHALVLILVVAAVITPPDVFTQTMVALPMYGLYEVGILIAGKVERTDKM